MITEDYSVTFNTNSFGEAITYMPAVGGSFSMVVHFDEKSRSVLDNISLDPVFYAPTSHFDIPPKRDDECEIRGKIYRVQEPEPDGHGVTVIQLESKP